jgi:anthranilate phosphoribosyltransferase
MKQLLEKLYAGESFSEAEAYDILSSMGEGQFNDLQISAFLSAYNMRPITVPELKGLRAAMLDLCLPLDLSDFQPMDVCGTGGDGKDTFNISTLSAFVVAGAGIPVAKHGNYAVSSHCGSSNVLESLGVVFTNDPDFLRKQIDKTGICILHAPLFHPAMKYVAPARRGMQVKTVFNILGPLTNPTRPKVQSTGVYSKGIARLYTYMMQETHDRFSIIHALDGYDEISLTGAVKVFSHKGERTLETKAFGIAPIDAELISGGHTIEDAAQIFMSVLKGAATKEQRLVVIANAAVAIATYKDIELEDALGLAAESLDSGKAFKSFEALVNTTA